jgi:terminal uridylyltransferase
MSVSESESKEEFRRQLETIMKEAIAREYSGDIATISLVGFGSLASGFGLPGSDMDLAVIPDWKDPSRADDSAIDRSIPRLLERAVLDAKFGGRLLTRTRVPILKICQHPTETLYAALTEERKKWDELPDEEKFPSDQPQGSVPRSKLWKESDDELIFNARKLFEPFDSERIAAIRKTIKDSDDEIRIAAGLARDSDPNCEANWAELLARSQTLSEARVKTESSEVPSLKTATNPDETASDSTEQKAKKDQNNRSEKSWTRERLTGPLDFPKTGCGIQCDINFANPLGIHNTHMLRCYSLTDPRVRPMVLFVKSWAKRRKVNSAYSGTLSSYGWVLMVLHYLVNVATPPVCPNLQHAVPLPSDASDLEQYFKNTEISGYEVRFWRNEQEIIKAAQEGRLTQNTQSIGELLRGFFQYYAALSGYGYPRPPQFHWTNEVLSLRTPGGIVSKQSKGWVSATTKITAEKKVTNRYLFAIEDPFETDHNVARTVTHRGIVAIRDEFRRAWRILRAIGTEGEPEGGIFDEIVEDAPPSELKAEEGPKDLLGV